MMGSPEALESLRVWRLPSGRPRKRKLEKTTRGGSPEVKPRQKVSMARDVDLGTALREARNQTRAAVVASKMNVSGSGTERGRAAAESVTGARSSKLGLL